MERFLKTARLRDLENQVTSGKITYSRMVELLNEEAFIFYVSKQNKQIDLHESIGKIISHLMDDNIRSGYIKNGWTKDQMINAITNSMVVFKQN